ncbi:hypothetical protein C456_04680 [Haloferax volcanii DSM 14919]|uniref:Uncharacterized protein n=1 Tax=Haloferax lucentense (strain DSM 14919 / JCM 9276 / NCIMB 13854 / Aa 2.2) TaxID=1230452 RepID=M0GZ16_HALL2|nr:hypothetical protein C456_04680 [Haloferax lucentense DSM 14919]
MTIDELGLDIEVIRADTEVRSNLRAELVFGRTNRPDHPHDVVEFVDSSKTCSRLSISHKNHRP